MNSSLDIIERVTARLTGPMNVRFILQPAMAIILGVRDGVRDAREGKPAFLLDLFTQPVGRKRHLKSAIQRLLIPFIVAILLDGVAQYLLFHQVRILGAVVLGVTIMGLPYSLARGLANRISTARSHTPVEAQRMKS